MAGVRQFDPDEVVDRAMEVFWTRGYESTSIDDLVEATGINRGSLYNAFGDKQGLFLAAIDRYWTTFADDMVAALSDRDPTQRSEGCSNLLFGESVIRNFPEAALLLILR